MPFFGTTAFAAPGLGLIASAVMLGFGLWWLARAERAARRAGEGFGGPSPSAAVDAAHDPVVRERATAAQSFDPAEAEHGQRSTELPGIGIAVLPLAVVMSVNLAMSMLILPSLDSSFLAEPEWGSTSIAAVGGVWSVIVALAAAIVVLYACNRGRLKSLRETVDAGLNAAALPVISVACLVGFGAVVAALPAFQVVSDWVLGIEGGPLVGLALSTNVLSALTGSASGGLTIALGALGETYMQMAAQYGIDPALMHRVAAIGAGSLDSLPHNGAVVTLLAVCGATHKQSYFDIVMVGIVSALLALGVVIVLGSAFGSF
jgi:H+/gluconate symporter-like permease